MNLPYIPPPRPKPSIWEWLLLFGFSCIMISAALVFIVELSAGYDCLVKGICN